MAPPPVISFPQVYHRKSGKKLSIASHKSKTTHYDLDWSLMATTVELEDDVVLGEHARAQEAASSEVSSYEGIAVHELTDQQIKAIINNGDFKMLHTRNKEIGMVFKSFTCYFQRCSPFIAAMRNKIKAPRGSHRQTEVEPRVWMSWAQYCKAYFGVTSRWIE